MQHQSSDMEKYDKIKKRIIFIDDDAIDRMAFQRFVRNEDGFPYEYSIASSLSEAKEMITSQQFDAVITDYILGDGTAFELFDLLTDTPVILVTGTGDEEVAIKAMKAGAYDYLIKDTDSNHLKILTVTVENAINRQKAEHELQQYREHLEELVETRTSELEMQMEERQRAEELLLLLKNSIEKIRMGITISDGNGKIIYTNPAEAEMHGYSINEILGEQVQKFALPEQRQLMDVEAIKKVKNWKRESINIRKDGSSFPVQLISTAVKNVNDELLGLITICEDITDRKIAEEELYESRKKYQTLVENLPDIIIRFDREYRHSFVSSSIKRFTGISARDFLGKTHDELNFDAQLCQFWQQNIQKVFDSGIRLNTQFEFESIIGKLIFDWRLIPEYDSNGNIESILSLQRDITQQKKAEQEIRESREKYFMLFNKMLEGFALHEIICDKNNIPIDYKFIDTNPAFEKLTGLKRDKVIGKTVLEILPNTEYSWIERYGKVALTGEPTHFDNYSQELDKYFEVTAFSLKRGQFACIFKDVTERKKAEQRIKHLNTVLNAIRTVNQLIVRETDPNRLIQEVCDTLVNTQGFRAAWIMLLNSEKKVIQTAEAGLEEHYPLLIDMLLNNDFPYCIKTALTCKEAVILGANIEYCKECSLNFFHDENEKISIRLEHMNKIYGTLTVSLPSHISIIEQEQGLLEEIAGDIAFALHNMNLEKEKDVIQNQLIQSQKMDAIGKLAGGVAHDFNNLLQAITLYSEILNMKMPKDDPLLNNVEQIKKAARSAASLTGQLLAFSRRQVLRLIPLDVTTVIQNITKMLNRLIGEDIKLITNYGTDIRKIKADGGQIEQVIMNLAVNARDAMADGGILTISVKNIDLDDFSSQTLLNARPGEFVCITVADNGTGMDQETKEQIFVPFFTTKIVGRGTGLGLSTVYGIIKQHKGWINVYSELNRGTKFDIYLPVCIDKTQDALNEKEESKYHGQGQRILFVEDEMLIRDVTVTMLEAKGFVVFSAENSMEALSIFEQEKYNFDLVISDVVLPDESGLSLVNGLLSLRPDLPVIMTSGYTDQKALWDDIKALELRFLQKPYSVDMLLKTIRETMENKTLS